jgi:hypothetical protein
MHCAVQVNWQSSGSHADWQAPPTQLAPPVQSASLQHWREQAHDEPFGT